MFRYEKFLFKETPYSVEEFKNTRRTQQRYDRFEKLNV